MLFYRLMRYLFIHSILTLSLTRTGGIRAESIPPGQSPDPHLSGNYNKSGFSGEMSNPDVSTLQIDPQRVVIVISSGTSGSTELCGIVSNIVKGDNATGPELFELLGGGLKSMRENTDPLRVALEYLSKEQAQHPGAFVGFKYKNYYHDKNYDKLLSWMAAERVKVIYNTRNPLDVYIGVLKSQSDGGKHNCNVMGAHLDRCVEKQQAIKVDVPIDEVLADLEEREKRNVEWHVRLKEHNINFMHVTYELINAADINVRIAYVQTIADFLLTGYVVTKETLKVVTEFIGHVHQKGTVRNYKELKMKLIGTRFERYLH